jgi:inhibitor of cysteine peptidase
MRRWIVGLAVMAALAACGSDDGGGGGARQVLDGGDIGTEITVGVGEEFEVRLESNATTGYAWQVVEQPDAVTLVSSEYEAPDTSLVGAGGVEVFVFEGVAEGSGEIRLEYVRSFDDPPVPAETAVFRVQVDGA